MNIEEVKRRIAQCEEDTANSLLWGIEHLRFVRKTVAEALSQRHVIIARHRRKILDDPRIAELENAHRVSMAALKREIAELEAAHRVSMAALKREIAEKVGKFDSDPDSALHVHLGTRIDDYQPEFIQGCVEMDRFERDLWAEYRRPKNR